MKKQMCEITVKTTEEGYIELIGPEYQDAEHELTNDSIRLLPDQIDTIVSWLKEAKEELQAN